MSKFSICNYNYKIVFNEGDVKFNVDEAMILFNTLAESVGLKVVGKIKHTFDCDICHSGVLLLSTSHLAWHTYPEDNFITLDINTCGGLLNESSIEIFLKEKLGCIDIHLNKSVFV